MTEGQAGESGSGWPPRPEYQALSMSQRDRLCRSGVLHQGRTTVPCLLSPGSPGYNRSISSVLTNPAWPPHSTYRDTEGNFKLWGRSWGFRKLMITWLQDKTHCNVLRSQCKGSIYVYIQYIYFIGLGSNKIQVLYSYILFIFFPPKVMWLLYYAHGRPSVFKCPYY